MSRIGKRFETLRRNGSKALITYITAGDPDRDTTKQLVAALEQSGADIIELGVPFSDPLADGATIQRASERALHQGITLSTILRTVEAIRTRSSIPLALMSYYNPILRYGEEEFVADAVRAGVDGVIVPDLPPEEAGRLMERSRAADFDTIFLLAPTSTVERVTLVARCSTGFVYCVSVTGVTGAREDIEQGLNRSIRMVRAHTDKPLAVGFGISTPDQARRVARVADGVIVGSALVHIVERNRHLEDATREMGALVRKMKDSIGTLEAPSYGKGGSQC